MEDCQVYSVSSRVALIPFSCCFRTKQTCRRHYLDYQSHESDDMFDASEPRKAYSLTWSVAFTVNRLRTNVSANAGLRRSGLNF